MATTSPSLTSRSNGAACGISRTSFSDSATAACRRSPRRPARRPRASGRSSRRPPPGNRSACRIRRPPCRRAARRRGRRCAAGRPADARCRGWRCRRRAAVSRMPNSRSASLADSVEVGSSRISTDDFAATARAMAISWRSAGRNSVKSRSSGRSRSSAAAISAARRRMARGVRKTGEVPEQSSSRIRFSATVRPGAPAWLVCWWTVAMPSARAACGDGIDHRLARDLDASGIGLQRARQDLHQRRLAGAVGPHQRDDLAARDDEIGAIQRPRRGKALVDAVGGYRRRPAIRSHRTISPPAPGRGRRSDRRRPRCRPTAAPANPKCRSRRASRPGSSRASSAPGARSGFRRRRGFRPA